MALSSLYAYIVGYAYSVVKRIGRVISDYLSSSGPEWTSAEREAAEARITDIRRCRALRERVQRDVEAAIAAAEGR